MHSPGFIRLIWRTSLKATPLFNNKSHASVRSLFLDCEDDSVPISNTWIGCPNGFIEEMIGTETKCSPIYSKHPGNSPITRLGEHFFNLLVTAILVTYSRTSG